MTRVSHAATAPSEGDATIERRLLVPPERGSELALDGLRLAPGAELELTDPLHDSVMLIHAGSGWVERSGAARDELEPLAAALVPSGTDARLLSGPSGLEIVRVTLGAAVDLHAPMGAQAPVVSLDDVEPGKATGARAFQLLHGPHNGSTRGTAFIGHIPPGKAPWHYHLYDEVLWVLRGRGRLHLDGTVEELEAGSAFRLHPREVHIVENADPVVELSILGVFTPAGSPSAAYLEPGVAATYAFA